MHKRWAYERDPRRAPRRPHARMLFIELDTVLIYGTVVAGARTTPNGKLTVGHPLIYLQGTAAEATHEF